MHGIIIMEALEGGLYRAQIQCRGQVGDCIKTTNAEYEIVEVEREDEICPGPFLSWRITAKVQVTWGVAATSMLVRDGEGKVALNPVLRDAVSPPVQSVVSRELKRQMEDPLDCSGLKHDVQDEPAGWPVPKGPVTAEEIAQILLVGEHKSLRLRAEVLADFVAERWDKPLRQNWCEQHRVLGLLDQPVLECSVCEWQKRAAKVQVLVNRADHAHWLLGALGADVPQPHPQLVAQVREELRAALDALKGTT
jgi:hypothetical protein